MLIANALQEFLHVSFLLLVLKFDDLLKASSNGCSQQNNIDCDDVTV
jgi:hypothetical protein